MKKELRTSGPVHADVRVPGSKSITNRALLCAALAQGDSLLRNASDSDDTGLMANGLNQLGVLVTKSGNVMFVQGTGGRLYAPKYPIPVGNAGTTFRFLLSLSSVATGTTVFETTERMAQRPQDALLDALRAQDVGVSHEAGSTQVQVRGGGLSGGKIAIESTKSSQFLSSILLVAPYARADVTVQLIG